MAIFRELTATALGLGLAGLSVPAFGQMPPIVDPSGALPAAPRVSAPAPADPGPATGGEAAGGEAAAAKGPSGLYYSDQPGEAREEEGYGFVQGPVPEVHVVRRGDTLWDLCGYYFANPWEWPRVWAYNPAIANPHWIYPGDLVRLMPEGSVGPSPTSAPAPTPAPPTELQAEQVQPSWIELRQLAFVDVDDIKFAGTILGSTDAKEMLSSGDEVYIGYKEGEPPQVSRRYAIYSLSEDVTVPGSKRKLGAYVLLRGEVEILEVKRGKRARAVITYANDVIERGQLVGPVKTQFKQVAPVPADRNLEGTIVAVLGRRELIGSDQVVFIDRGFDQGVKIGNRFLVVRRGDAHQERMGPSSEVGRNDTRYPDEAVAQVTVVDGAEGVAIAVVNHAMQELGVGDRVVMRKGK